VDITVRENLEIRPLKSDIRQMVKKHDNAPLKELGSELLNKLRVTSLSVLVYRRCRL